MRIFYILFSFFFLSCETEKTTEESLLSEARNTDQKKFMDSFFRKKETITIHRSEIPYTKITPSSNIKIISAIKLLDTASIHYEDYRESCNEWNLTIENIKVILTSSKEIDGHQWHHYYNHLPCYYSGIISIDGKKGPFEVNAGAFSVILFKDTSVHLGYDKPDSKKYFPSGRYIE